MTPGELQERLDEVADRYRHPITVDPLHERVREAIEALDLDGSSFELAVAIFGWGSDEANGSLLGLVRTAWADPHAVPLWTQCGWSVKMSDMNILDGSNGRAFAVGPTEIEVLIKALEVAPR